MRISNLPTRHKLPQQRIDAGLPAGAAASQMLDGLGIEADFYFDLGRIQLGVSAPGWLHSGFSPPHVAPCLTRGLASFLDHCGGKPNPVSSTG